MPFYEVLKLLMTEPGKHHFRRKSCNLEYDHSDTKYICSIGIAPQTVQILIAKNDNNTGYTYQPSADDIIANDWIEV